MFSSPSQTLEFVFQISLESALQMIKRVDNYRLWLPLTMGWVGALVSYLALAALPESIKEMPNLTRSGHGSPVIIFKFYCRLVCR